MPTPAAKPGSQDESFLSGDVWLSAQKAVPRFYACTFLLFVLVPASLAVIYSIVLAHDLYYEKQTQPCWEPPERPEGAIKAMHFAGLFVHWLSMDMHGKEYYCSMVPKPEGLFVECWVLIPTWLLIIFSAWKTRRLRRDKGIIRSLLEKVYRAVQQGQWTAPEGYLGQVQRNAQTEAILQALEKDGRGAKWQHVRYAVLFQLSMLLFDLVIKNFTLRWILWYQVIWFSFWVTLVQVRPLVKLTVYLSRTLVDLYIELLRERRGSWLELLQWHRELELDVLNLWKQVNLHVIIPSVPFVGLSFVHFLSDRNEVSGSIVACYLLILAGIVLVLILQPIAHITSQFNSPMAFKAEPKLAKGTEPDTIRKPGSMAIVAVARSLALEAWPRSAHEDQQYASYLEYVQGSKISIALGVQGYLMVPIDSGTVAGIFSTFILKLPLFVSLFLAARHNVDKVAAQRREMQDNGGY